MAKTSCEIILCFFYFILSFRVISVSAQQTCDNTAGSFKPNSTYDNNRRLILSTFASNVTAQNGYFNGSFGLGTDRVYAMGMCAPGAEPDVCSNCIKNTAEGLLQICLNQTDGFSWSGEETLCLVRYSNKSFSGLLGLEPSNDFFNVNEIRKEDQKEFDSVFDDLMIRTIQGASSSVRNNSNSLSLSGKYYAKDVAPEPVYGNISVVMQCTPDVSSKDCNICLERSVDFYKKWYNGKRGTIILRPSCFFRWELYTFFGAFDSINARHPPPPPRPLSPPPLKTPSVTNITKKNDSRISGGTIAAIVVVVVVTIILIVVGLVICKRRKQKQEIELPTESVQFDLKTIEAATGNFSEHNKLGAGGFGEGMLLNGTEIAVKRLSKTSGQGEIEFKNEVVVVAKLQHINLVRLLGFSLQGEEKLLVYEFVPNKSLDYFLFVNNLVTYVWKLWENKTMHELIDPFIKEDCKSDEVIRYVHIGLLCVQENPADRPTMSTIHQVLTTSSITLPVPQPPGFFFRNGPGSNPSSQGMVPGQSSSKSFTSSVDEATITQRRRKSYREIDIQYSPHLSSNNLMLTSNILNLHVPQPSRTDGLDFSISSAQKCGKTGLFKPNDKYDINRHLLLSSLASNVSARGGFYNASIGQGPDRLYASGTCIQGSEPELCSACIDSAFIRVIKKCHNQTEALDWSSFNEEYPCMIRYSNRSFFGLLEMTPFFKNYNATDFQVNLTEFYQKWEALMLGVIADAISSPNPKFYGAGTGKIGIQTVYAFVLCSKDISPWNCSRCLRGNVDNYKLSCSGKPRGHSFSPSCYMRWDLYQFYGFIEYRASPTLPREKDGGNISTRNILGITVALAFFITLSLSLFFNDGYISLAGRSMTTYGTAPPDDDDITTSGSLQFDFKAIEAATNNFQKSNKLGHGGFVGNLVTYVWRLWNNESFLELVDPAMGESYDKDEVIRCIHISLLVRSESNPLAERLEPGPSTTMSFRASAQDPRFLAYYCPNATTYSSNSTYFTNLKTLLSSLSSRNASYSTGFQNATSGKAPDRVTGLFLCRGDFSPEVCRSCVTFAVNDTFNRCSDKREAVFYYEQCILRYSDKNILSTVTYDGALLMKNPNNISSNQRDSFVASVSSTMNQAAIVTANSSRKFYTLETELTPVQTLYGLLQCTPDLTRQDCLSCLQSSINEIPLYRVGGRLVYPRKGGNSNVLVVAIVVPITVVVLLLIAGYCFLAKRAKKTFDTVPTFDGDDITTVESLQLNYKMIRDATNNFVVDTSGYMSPEYAINGQFSVKSDVYSFGVLVLEIISGKKNSSFYDTDVSRNVVSYAWSLWSKGTAMDLVDPIIIDNCQKSEVARCIHICLLCVQDDPEERPILSTIYMMLTNDTVTLSVPQQPGFFVQS
ncbi:unnamed protein product [Arabidopsis thaliana]|uniref:(thale cress) hypothetical protein n=1 Tax=Arabidopsis thaliana TaxID=3702 RepID=A0A7G2EZM7_ARATH|nr:unnamed protein product [Arabidopsis thaliana]